MDTAIKVTCFVNTSNNDTNAYDNNKGSVDVLKMIYYLNIAEYEQAKCHHHGVSRVIFFSAVVSKMWVVSNNRLLQYNSQKDHLF